jgi:hypothetical protein
MVLVIVRLDSIPVEIDESEDTDAICFTLSNEYLWLSGKIKGLLEDDIGCSILSIPLNVS